MTTDEKKHYCKAIGWEYHPIMNVPSLDELTSLDPATYEHLKTLYHDAIRNAEHDPYTYGFDLPHWEEADNLIDTFNDVLFSGANRSGKSFYASSRVVKAAIKNKNALIYVMCQDEDSSIELVEPYIFKALPASIREPGREFFTYTQKNGFTGRSLIIPTSASKIAFKTYSQFLNNDMAFEGRRLGARAKDCSYLNIGLWMDEYTVNPEIINTLRARLSDNDAKCMITVTPIKGYTEIQRQYMEGATTVKAIETTPDFKKREVPYIMHNPTLSRAVMFFPADKNPFANTERLRKDLVGEPEEFRLIKLYGYPTKAEMMRFPKFDTEVHVLPQKTAGELDLSDATTFMVCDPAGTKQWFITWIAVFPDGGWIIYDEFPRQQQYGWWAEPNKKAGKSVKNQWAYGDGAAGSGYGYEEYVRIITEAEKDHKIRLKADTPLIRFIDPRLGVQARAAASGVTSIQDEMRLRGIYFKAAPRESKDAGLHDLQDLMNYDASEEISAINQPKFHIAPWCLQTIKAIQCFTGEGGPEEPWKDPIDNLRYAAISRLQYMVKHKNTTYGNEPRSY